MEPKQGHIADHRSTPLELLDGLVMVAGWRSSQGEAGEERGKGWRCLVTCFEGSLVD